MCVLSAVKHVLNKLLQPCTARTVWSDWVNRLFWLMAGRVIESTEPVYETSHELEGGYLLVQLPTLIISETNFLI